MYILLIGSDAEHTRVELRVDGLDEPLLGSPLVGVLLDLEDDDASDKLGGKSRPPAKSDLVHG